jgi:hypothetical protein
MEEHLTDRWTPTIRQANMLGNGRHMTGFTESI